MREIRPSGLAGGEDAGSASFPTPISRLPTPVLRRPRPPRPSPPRQISFIFGTILPIGLPVIFESVRISPRPILKDCGMKSQQADQADRHGPDKQGDTLQTC